MENNYDHIKECREAFEAGNRALASLKNAKSCLDSARNWGIWDMFGGGFLAGLIKRTRISDAQSQIDEAKWNLKEFARELDDVHTSVRMDIEINDFIGYADLLWDNFLVDWMMQDRINGARAQLDEAINRVEQVLRTLRQGMEP